MATLRDIRRRIGGVKSTQKITKAMKMVAAAKLRRAQDAMIAARPYARKMKEILQHLASTLEIGTHPLLTVRPVDRVALIVITSDRGLCGAFNSNLIKAAVVHIWDNYAEIQRIGGLKLECVGKKGYDFFIKHKQYKVASKHIGIFGALSFSHARAIVDEVVQGFLNGECDRVEFIYNEFKSVIQQRITVEQLLPIPVAGGSQPAVLNPFAAPYPASNVPYIYEPSPRELLEAIIPKHLSFQVWRALLESNAAEQGARMTSMDQATTNAGEMIDSLLLSYNKARQAAITKELLEIVSAAEALAKAG
jgi:F-type H+-transporting ATPase subunit gamma